MIGAKEEEEVVEDGEDGMDGVDGMRGEDLCANIVQVSSGEREKRCECKLHVFFVPLPTMG